MPPPRNLRAFLAAARKALAAPASQRQTPLTFVVGNEAADLDSLCSAVLYAFLRSHAPPNYALHIPLCNIPREDLSLRPEVGAVLRYANAGLDDLLTLSDLDEAKDLRPEDTRWLLADHNALTGALDEKFSSRVVGCVDHHQDEGRVPQDTGDEPRLLRKTGSCMSLVVESCRAVWEELTRSSENGREDGDLGLELAHVALGPILIDTENLTSESKTTETDTKAVDFLESRLKPDPTFNRKKFFEQVYDTKADLTQFSYRDIFRKDYKQWTEDGMVLGTAGSPRSISYMLKHIGSQEEFLSELKKFAEERKLDIAVVMTATVEEDFFKRDLLVWALNGRAVQTVQKFVSKEQHNLGLQTFQDGTLDMTDVEGQLRFCWHQKEVKHSRKQIGPMLRTFMKETPKL